MDWDWIRNGRDMIGRYNMRREGRDFVLCWLGGCLGVGEGMKDGMRDDFSRRCV